MRAASASPCSSDNLLHALHARECLAAPPGAGVHGARRVYEALEHPADCLIARFTDDGQRLVCFSRDLQHLVVYRYDGLAAASRGESAEAACLPAHARLFGSYFTHLYTARVTAGHGAICRDFCLFFHGGAFGVLATSAPAGEATQTTAAAAVPLLQAVSLHVLRMSDGVLCDRRDFADDYMSLSQNACASAFDDLLTVLSLRHQTVHVYRLDAEGCLTDVTSVGAHCDPGDDALLRQRAALSEAVEQLPGQSAPASALTGLKQRLLSFLFLDARAQQQEQPGSSALRPVQMFYRHFCSYQDLLVWRAHLLSSCQLVIQFAFPDSRQTFHALQPAFLGVYDFRAARFVAFVSCSSDDLFDALARSTQQLCPLASDTMWARCAYDQAARRHHQPLGASRHAHQARRIVGSSGALTPHGVSFSPYMDHRLFQFDDKMVSERPRPCVDYPIKFSSKSRHNTVRFRLSAEPLMAGGEGRAKWVSSFVFHPVHPFALSVLQSVMHPQQINAHFRWQ